MVKMAIAQFVFILFITETIGGWMKYFPRPYTKVEATTLGEQDFEKKPAIILNDYYLFDNNQEELDVFSQIHQINSHNFRLSHFYNLRGRTVLVLKTLKHRNKRYTNYLTLCPFKICNMGRKRMRAKRSNNKIKRSSDGRYSS